MARLAYTLNTQHSNSPQFQIGPKKHFVDDESDTILDDCILERPAPDSSPHAMGHQRESFADEAPTMSPRDSRWSEFAFPSDATTHLQSSAMTSPLFFEQGGQAFVQNDSVNGSMYTHPSAWQGSNDQDSCTPTTTYDVFPSDPDVKGIASNYHDDSLHPPASNMYGGLPVGQPPPFYSGNSLSTSPRAGQDWSSISSAEPMDLRSIHRSGPVSSPTYNPNPPLLRRDGIRKKNARFEIPAERTLRTIDTLINQTTDEQEIKELKQQKRLLRNRQAA